MLDKLKAEWQEIRRAPAGQRFVKCYERHQARDAPWLKPILFFAAVFSFVVGVILAFIPGPAILFFAISAGLLACEYRPVATGFDKVELAVRRLIEKYRGRRRKKHSRARTKAGRIDPEMLAQLRAAGVVEPERAHESAANDERGPQMPAASPPAGAPIDMSRLDIPEADPARAKTVEREATPAAEPQPNLEPTAPQPTAAAVDMSKLQVPDAPPMRPPSAAVIAAARGEAPPDAGAANHRRDVWWMPKAAPASELPDLQVTRHPMATAPTSMEDLLAARDAQEAQLAAARKALELGLQPTEETPRLAGTQQPAMPVQTTPARVAATVKWSVPLPSTPTPIAPDRPALPVERTAGTMKIWTPLAPEQPPVILQDPQSEPVRELQADNSIVTLPPPAIIGEKKRSRPSARADRRATPPPPPRS